jgi:hypothetical protein
MALYVVVHHNRDANRPWVNSWLDDERLEAIQTTRQIGEFCRAAKKENELIFVHRCGWGEAAPTICCLASAVQVGQIDEQTSLVTFDSQEVLNAQPPVTPTLGQNLYMAAPVNLISRVADHAHLH